MAKQFLDSTGLNALWGKITAGFAPTWKAVDISAITVTPQTSDVVLGFSTTGPNPANTNNGVISGTLTIPAATQSKAGILTSADKKKIDEMSTSISTSILFNGLNINGNPLKLTDKIANFNLVYNSTSDTLDIVDVNDNNAVKTSVSVNSFIGDAILNGVLSSAEIVNKNDTGTEGTFLKLVFTVTKNDGTSDSSTIYANVADLVSTYEAGTGIKIETSNAAVDNTAVKATITLKAAATNAIGGIKVSKVFSTNPAIQSATTHKDRYFPVETTKEGLAIVNIPASSLSVGAATETTDILLHGGTFSAITGLTPSTDGNSGSTLVPTVTTFTLPSVPDITVTANNTTEAKPAHTGTFTVISAITKDAHGFKYTPTTVTLPAETKLALGNDGEAQTVTLKPGKVTNATIMETLTVSDHTITRDFVTIEVDDPESIPDATINALAYPS